MIRSKKSDQGSYLGFPKHRRIVLDICNASRTVPAFAVDRKIQLERVFHARKSPSQRIGWAAIFAKAYAIVAADVPELRRIFMSYPWPRFYQHPTSVVSITVNRFDEAIQAERLVWARIRNVEKMTLVEVQSAVDEHQHGDPKLLLRESRILDAMPTPLRAVFWHLMMRWAGRKRARLLGTFSLSTLATYGTTNHSHPLVVTTSLSYGPLDDDFCSRVTLQADHRVVDGAIVARALVRLEEVLNNEIVIELRALAAGITLPQTRAA